jgi:hypothetical protein
MLVSDGSSVHLSTEGFATVWYMLIHETRVMILLMLNTDIVFVLSLRRVYMLYQKKRNHHAPNFIR